MLQEVVFSFSELGFQSKGQSKEGLSKRLLDSVELKAVVGTSLAWELDKYSIHYDPLFNTPSQPEVKSLEILMIKT